MSNSVYAAIPIMLLLAVLQTAALPSLPIFGLVPQLPFLVALAWGLVRGFQEGLIWAFVAGIAVGLFSLAPLGLSALAYMASIGIALRLQAALPPRRLPVAISLAMLATAIYLIIFTISLRLFGFGTTAGAALDLMPLVLLHAVLIIPIVSVTGAISNALRPRRVEL
jgi:rod shape-determining protein MreD